MFFPCFFHFLSMFQIVLIYVFEITLDHISPHPVWTFYTTCHSFLQKWSGKSIHIGRLWSADIWSPIHQHQVVSPTMSEAAGNQALFASSVYLHRFWMSCQNQSVRNGLMKKPCGTSIFNIGWCWLYTKTELCGCCLLVVVLLIFCCIYIYYKSIMIICYSALLFGLSLSISECSNLRSSSPFCCQMACSFLFFGEGANNLTHFGQECAKSHAKNINHQPHDFLAWTSCYFRSSSTKKKNVDTVWGSQFLVGSTSPLGSTKRSAFGAPGEVEPRHAKRDAIGDLKVPVVFCRPRVLPCSFHIHIAWT